MFTRWSLDDQAATVGDGRSITMPDNEDFGRIMLPLRDGRVVIAHEDQFFWWDPDTGDVVTVALGQQPSVPKYSMVETENGLVFVAVEVAIDRGDGEAMYVTQVFDSTTMEHVATLPDLTVFDAVLVDEYIVLELDRTVREGDSFHPFAPVGARLPQVELWLLEDLLEAGRLSGE